MAQRRLLIKSHPRREAPRTTFADPTRTGGLRRQFVAELRRQFSSLKAELFRIQYDDSFSSWFEERARQILLSSSQERLWGLFVDSAFRRGASRSFDDVVPRSESRDKPEFDRGSREGFLTALMAEGTPMEPGFVMNVFCPTGEGGGVDPTCSPKLAWVRGGVDEYVASRQRSTVMGKPKVDGDWVPVPETFEQIEGGKDQEAIWNYLGRDLMAFDKAAISEVNVTDLVMGQPIVKISNITGPPHDSPINVVKYKGKLIVQDGHHRLMRSMFAGSTKVTAKIVDVPSVTTNVERIDMPQVRKADWEEFLTFARQRTTLVREDGVDPATLSAIQHEFSQERVDAIPMEKLAYPILVSLDGFVIDGNHRWIKASQTKTKIPVLRIGLKRNAALDMIRSFPKSEYVTNALFSRLRSAFDTVKALAKRAWDEFTGGVRGMVQGVQRAATDGVLEGKTPQQVVREAIKVIDRGFEQAKGLVQTEVTRAHAKGQLVGFVALGVKEVGVLVEWRVVRNKDGTIDSKVCPSCRAMEGVVLKISEADGLIPLHKNCRCSFSKPRIDAKGQKRNKGDIDKAIAKARARRRLKPGQGWAAKTRIAQKRPTITTNHHSLLSKFDELTRNVFCPTGKGGGVDPTCSPNDSWRSSVKDSLKKGIKVFRGVGRGQSNDYGAAGKGRYYSGSKQVAEAYGKIVEEDTISLNNPYIASYSELTSLQESLYGRPLTGFEKDLSEKFDQYLKSNGYDGVALFDFEISKIIPQEVVRLGRPKIERTD